MGKTLIELAKENQSLYENDIILAKVDGKLRELREEATSDNIEFLTTDLSAGSKTYKRSVVLMMLYSIYQISPKDSIQKVSVQYSISKSKFEF